MKETAYSGAISGAFLGLFLSFQVLVHNGYFGMNLETTLLSLYVTFPSVLLFIFLASIIYRFLLLIESISSRAIRKRRITLLFLFILCSALIIRYLVRWVQTEGNDAILYSSLAALFVISLLGVAFALFHLLSRTEANRKRMILLALIMLGIFFSSHQYYDHMWRRPVDSYPDGIPDGKSGRKVLIIGLDSANWHVMNRLMEERLLPNLKKIMDEGVHGPLKTIKPTISPIIWTSIVTGKHHREHGINSYTYYFLPGISRPLVIKDNILDFILIHLRRKKAVKLAPFTVKSRKSEALWNILALRGHSAGIVSWTGTIKGGELDKIDGFLISDRFKMGFMAAPPPETILPDSIYDEVVEFNEMPVFDSLPQFLEELNTETVGFDEFIAGLESVERKVHLTVFLVKKFDPDIIFFYDHFLDSIQHRFWRFMEPDEYQEDIPEDQVELYGRIIDYTYMYLDYAVKRLVEGTGNDMDVMIVSDHGMEPIPLTVKGSSKRNAKETNLTRNVLSAHHYNAQPGIFIAQGKGIKKGARVSKTSIYDITPTLLYMFDFPVASDMEGRVLEEIFEESYLADHPQRSIPTYETGEDSKEIPLSPTEMDEDVLKDIKALGYLQ